jgi:hypothetical protein
MISFIFFVVSMKPNASHSLSSMATANLSTICNDPHGYLTLMTIIKGLKQSFIPQHLQLHHLKNSKTTLSSSNGHH